MSDPPPNTPPSADKRVEFDVGGPSEWTAEVSTGDLPISVVWPASARVDGAGTFSADGFVFPPEWEERKQEAIRLLASLPQVLREADQALRLVEEMRRFSVGGNNPPEEIEALPPAEEIITEATVAGDALRAELTADQPHLSSIRVAARALKRVSGWVGAMARWVGQKADTFLDEYLKQLGKPAAYLTVGVIGARLTGVTTHLDSITTLVTHLLGSLHIPL